MDNRGASQAMHHQRAGSGAGAEAGMLGGTAASPEHPHVMPWHECAATMSKEDGALTGLVGCTAPFTSIECAAEPGVVLKSPATCIAGKWERR